MSTKWLVTFIDEGNCEICSVEVECARIANASKVAARVLSEDQERLVFKESVKMMVQAIVATS